MIHICGPKDAPKGVKVVNTTSRSKTWSRGLSPFLLGPVKLYGSFTSKNVENAWQFCKVYSEHIDPHGNPSEEYFQWAQNGWNDIKAHRYPMGKGRKPEYSFWNGQSLTYVEARKIIYFPLYSKAVSLSSAFYSLLELAKQQEIWLWDFDGYNHEALGKSLEEVLNDSSMKCGHAFVLKMMLTAGGLEKWAQQWWPDDTTHLEKVRNLQCKRKH